MDVVGDANDAYSRVSTFDDLLSVNSNVYAGRIVGPFYGAREMTPFDTAVTSDLERLTREARVFTVDERSARIERTVKDGEEVDRWFGSCLSMLCEPPRLSILTSMAQRCGAWCFGFEYATEMFFVRGGHPRGTEWGEPAETTWVGVEDVRISGTARDALDAALAVRWNSRWFLNVAAVVDRCAYVEMVAGFDAPCPMAESLIRTLDARPDGNARTLRSSDN